MARIPDNISLSDLCREAAHALSRAGLEHRIDIYREVEVDDPAVRTMLGRSHRVRVRLRITASSLLFEDTEASGPADDESTLSDEGLLNLSARV